MTNPDVSEADVANRTCTFPDCERKHKARGFCDIHYFQWRTKGEVKPIRKWADAGQPCRVCGAPAGQRARRRTVCSDACAQLLHTYGGSRPESLTCHYCAKQFSTQERDGSGRLQRVDTIWCPDCGRESPDVQRFKRYGVTREQYQKATEAGCPICLRTDRPLHVDHGSVEPPIT